MAKTLTNGLGELATGSQTWGQGLNDAKGQLNVATTEKENAKTLADPVTCLKQTVTMSW